MPIACSLDGAAFRDRAEWMRDLGGSLLEVEANCGTARLRFDRKRHGELEDFVRAESACCAFFEFSLTAKDGASELAIAAPEDAAWAVRGLVAGFVAGLATHAAVRDDPYVDVRQGADQAQG